MAYTRAVEKKGNKLIFFRTTRHQNSHLTLMLECTADGAMLSRYIFLNRKTLKKTRYLLFTHWSS